MITEYRHNFVNKKVLDNAYEEMNRRMDEPSLWFGKEHRAHFHSPWDIFILASDIIIRSDTPPDVKFDKIIEYFKGGLLHLICDKYCGAIDDIKSFCSALLSDRFKKDGFSKNSYRVPYILNAVRELLNQLGYRIEFSYDSSEVRIQHSFEKSLCFDENFKNECLNKRIKNRKNCSFFLSHLLSKYISKETIYELINSSKLPNEDEYWEDKK